MDEIDCLQVEIIELQERIKVLKRILEIKLKNLANNNIALANRQRKTENIL